MPIVKSDYNTMSEFMYHLYLAQDLQDITNKRNVNHTTFMTIYKLKSLTDIDIAQKLGMHKITIIRYKAIINSLTVYERTKIDECLGVNMELV